MRIFYFTILLLTFIATCNVAYTQTTGKDTSYKKIVPEPAYKAPAFKRWVWGNNYRNEWTMPATIKVLWVDSAAGHFKNIYSNRSEKPLNFHVQNAQGREFLIRPVNQTLGKNLPALFRNTFIENKLTDAGSASNPYAGAPIPIMAKAANIYSANINYRYVPAQPILTNYDSLFGNDIYVFEEIVPGNFKNYITTTTLLNLLSSNPDISIDEPLLIKARLFDMFLNDWNRPERNWLWGEIIKDNKTVYEPLPVNRDQALSDYDGFLFGAGIGASGLNYFQKFNNNIPSVKYINQREKDFDRRLLNQASRQQWQNAAKDLQQSLTDKIIDDAVKQFPPEIYAKIGNEIAAKLKERRKHILKWANEYYYFLSQEVEVTGSDSNDLFDVQRINNKEILVKVFSANNNTPFYSRTFKVSETKEIRLFGLKGNDTYRISGNGKNDIAIKISDGINKDSVIDVSSLSKKNNNIIVYAKDNVATNNANSIKINNDTVFRSYRYDWFRYNRKGLTPIVFYSMEDRFYAGLTYRILNNKWDRRPFVSAQSLSVHYSFMELAPSITYKALFPRLVIGSDLSLLANYDFIRWQFYFGLGNNTKYEKAYKQEYYTTRTRQWIFQPQLSETFGRNTISISGDIQGIKVMNDSSEFIAKPGMNTTGYDWQTYAGGGIKYSYKHLDNPIIPLKGFYFDASAFGEQNLNNPSSHYIKYEGNAYVYIPLVSKFSLNIRTGASTVTGNPEFYQYAGLGGLIFRGSSKDRFRGKTAFYNSNDIRYIAPFHSWFFNGKAGVLAFCDNGRVWLPGENSNAWHVAYGVGLIVAPFNFIYADASLGFFKNEKSVQVRITMPIVR